MTVKEISKAVNRDVRTVQFWVKEVGKRVKSIDDKRELSSPRYPANYDSVETFEILKHGWGEKFATLYRDMTMSKDKTEAVTAEFKVVGE